MIPVVLSGGSGTRLWPISRAKYPKQFCEIFENTLQTLTLKRLQSFGTPWVLTSQLLKDFTETQARLSGIEIKALFEPMAKNTAPAIAFLVKSLEIAQKMDQIIGVFPADQLIEKEDEFKKAVNLAVSLAEKNKIVTLGIQPTLPATGYGYIQVAEKSAAQGSAVLKFHEKPDLEKAKIFLQEGNYFWNAGIFIFKAAEMKKALQRMQPEIWTAMDKLKPDLTNLKEIYQGLPVISIDYAIMEKLDSSVLTCVPCEIGWSDVGSWDAVAEIMTKPMGLKGKNFQHPIEIKAKGNFVFSQQKKDFSFVGVDDLIVIDTKDALLVAKKGSSQEVKAVVEALTKSNKLSAQSHVYEERPWGKFEILRDEINFKSKVIHVHAKQQLSLQSHAKREEHWVVTAGRGEVVLSGNTIQVEVGSHVHIPVGSQHRMRNTGDKTLEFIEVQLGSYFGEDDIIRYQDDYNRK